MKLGLVLGVDGALMAKGCSIGKMIDDEAFHELAIKEISIKKTHFRLIDPS